MWHIIHRKLWTQRSELKIMLVMAGISLMMIFAFGDFSGSYKPKVMVADADQSQLSQQFVALLNEDAARQYSLMDSQAGLNEVKNGRAIAMISLEKGFEAALQKGQAAKLSMISVKSDADTMTLKPALLNAYNQLYRFDKSAGDIAKAAADKGASYETVYAETYSLLVSSKANKPALTLSLGDDGSAALKNSVMMHSLIGFLIFFVAYSCVFGAADLLVERRQNTWQRLVISPSSKLAMLSGHLVVSWIVGLIQLFLVLTVGHYLFGVDFGGSLPLMFGAAAIFCLAMSGFGILLSAFGKSMQQISALTSVLLTAFGMLGGCLWPLDLVTNPILIQLSKVIPHRYAVEALTQLSQGESWTSILPQLGVMMAIALTFLLIGFVKILRTEEQFQ